MSAGLGIAWTPLYGSSFSISSAMMSLQSPMHSSQMYTVGPAISFLTSFCALPQNEQVNEAPSRFSIGIVVLERTVPRRPGLRLPRLLGGDEDLVDQAVLLGLRRAHEVVPVGVLLDLVDGLAGVLRVQLVEPVAHLQDLA